MTNFSNNLKIPFILFAICFLVNSIFITGHIGGDGLQDYLAAESILTDHDVFIYDRVNNAMGTSAYDNSRDNTISKNATSSYGIGLALIDMPMYTMGYLISKVFPYNLRDNLIMMVTSATSVIVGSLLFLYIFLLFAFYDKNRVKNLIIATGVIFTTIIWVNFKIPYRDMPLALLYTMGFYYLKKYNIYKESKYLYLTSFFVAFSILVKTVSIIVMAPFIIYLFWDDINRINIKTVISKLSIFLSFSILSLILSLYYNYLRFNDILNFGQNHEPFTNSLLVGLYTYLFSSGRGIILYAPILLLSIWFIGRFAKKEPKDTILSLSIFVLYIVLYSKHSGGYGCASWGPRYLLPTIPFLAIFLSQLDFKIISHKVGFFVFALMGFLVQFPVMLLNYSYVGAFFQELGKGEDIIYSPYISPIIGHWLVLKNLLSGTNAFDLRDVVTVISSHIMPQEVLRFDIWAVNILTIFNNLYVKLFIIMYYIFIVLIISLLIFLNRKDIRLYFSKEN